MQPPLARIPARSRRQAMDWSLVLVSQGIETTIEYSNESTGWELLVAAQDCDKALKTLRQYRLENRGWAWQQDISLPGFRFDWGGLAWVLLVSLFFWLNTLLDLRRPGVMDSVAMLHGQWWRLFTAIWLHADLAHLAANAVLGFVLLGLTMGRYGTGVGLLAAYLTGAGANFAAWLVASQPYRSLGASGMVMGSLGLLAVQSFSLGPRTRPAMKYILSGIFGGVMLFVLLGLTPGTDVIAHLGGFVVGLLLGRLLALVPAIEQKAQLNLISGLVFALLVTLPWWLALHGMHGMKN